MANIIYTEKQIAEARAEFEKNELYQQSTSLYKDYQLEQFDRGDGIPMEGRCSRTDLINGKEVLVIFNFINGFVDNLDETLPSIEYPNHWEYWKEGLIKRVVDIPTNTEEIWENGIPVEIKNYNPEQ